MGPATATRPLVVLSRTPASTRELICRINYSRRHAPGKRHSEEQMHSTGTATEDVQEQSPLVWTRVLAFCARSGLNATLGFVHCRGRTHFPRGLVVCKEDKKTQIGTFLSAEIKHVALSQLQNGLGLSARRPSAPRSSRSASGGGVVGEKKPRRHRQKLFHPRSPRTQRHAAVRVQGRRRRSATLETEKLGDP